MKTLSREEIQRMVGRSNSRRNVAGNNQESSSQGFATPSWVDENYLSKSFFSTLFIIHATQTVTVTDDQGQPVGEPTVTEITLAPNLLPGTTSVTDSTTGYTTTTVIAITSIEATKDFYSDGGVSALGQSSGGGGGGASALTDLVDVAISSPTNGQVLMYNSSTGKWYNGTVQSGGGGTVTSIAAGTGLTGGTITSSGTIALSQETQAAIANGVTAYGWGDHSQAGYLTSSALTGYATQSWVQQQGYLTSSAISDMATKTWVGQQGYLTSSAISDMATKTWVNNQGFLKASDLNGYATKQWVGQNYLGKNDTAAAATKLQTARNLWGNSFDGTADIGTPNSNATLKYVADINMSGNLTCQNVFADTEIRFHESGNWWWTLGYEAGISNSSFNLVRYNNSTYVTTVLLSADTNGGISVNSGQLWVKQSAQGIRIGDAFLSWDSANNALKVTKYDGTAINMYSLGGVSALGAWTGSNGDITVTGVTATGDIQGASIIATTKVKSPKFYLDNTRYIYLYGTPGGPVLMYYDGTTSKGIKLVD